MEVLSVLSGTAPTADRAASTAAAGPDGSEPRTGAPPAEGWAA